MRSGGSRDMYSRIRVTRKAIAVLLGFMGLCDGQRGLDMWYQGRRLRSTSREALRRIIKASGPTFDLYR